MQVLAAGDRRCIQERSHLGLEDEDPHLSPGRRVRLHDAIRAGAKQLVGDVLFGGSRDDEQVGPFALRRDRDVEVVDVRVGGSHEPARPGKADGGQVVVVRPVAVDVQVAVLAGRFERVLVEVEHDVVDA